MAENTPTYRPHDPGHDYYAPGIYLITLVVRHRRENVHLLGVLGNDVKSPRVELTDVGKAVMACWEEIPERHAKRGRKLVLHGAVCMPDHFHGVIEVLERMDVSVGEVIRGFKAGCTMAWKEIQRPSMATDGERQTSASMATCMEEQTKATDGERQTKAAGRVYTPAAMATVGGAVQPYLDEQAEREMLRHMSKKQRAAYYALHKEAQQPLWDDNYDDTICLNDPKTGKYSIRHFNAMVQYVNDNVRRAIIMKQRPQFMQRCMHVRITGKGADGMPVDRDYAAFGNLFLLRWARKIQVFCHRLARRGMLTDDEWQKATASNDAVGRFEAHAKAHKLGHFDREWSRSSLPDTITPIDYTRTTSCRTQHDEWVAQILAGATVLVTPGISRGEQLMKDECIERGFPLIHLQKTPIGPLWKPEKKRFDACACGALLILAPWKADELGEVKGVPSTTDYSVFHNLNKLAEEICYFEGGVVV